MLEAGVPVEAMQVELGPSRAIKASLQRAKPGDLLLVLSGSSEFEQIWQQAEALKADLQSAEAGGLQTF